IIKSFKHFSDGMVYKEVRDSISAEVQRYNITNPNKTGALIGSNELAKLYRAFVELLLELDNKVDSENQNTIRLIYSEFLSSKDPVLADFCLTGLLDSLYLQHRTETSQILLFDFNELDNPNDLDVMVLFINAMGELKNSSAKGLLEKNLKSENYEIAKASAEALFKITGKNYENEITAPRYRTDFDWYFIENLSTKKFATIKTNKGDIKLELFPDIAPFTVQNFVKLAEKKYYDGTVFHRVVPNFVIQGGDPTGTGYSGPGYSIRSEFSPLTYERGYLGMASSGKDTEGSQFFITHSPQPHLDGRYTIFGKVIEGMEVVDNIMVGDVINSIRINNY
ncbi:MAG: peptidylprolyl isomerase, partial [Ignavibacteria bacterium]